MSYHRSDTSSTTGKRIRVLYVLSGALLSIWGRVEECLNAHQRNKRVTLKVIRVLETAVATPDEQVETPDDQSKAGATTTAAEDTTKPPSAPELISQRKQILGIQIPMNVVRAVVEALRGLSMVMAKHPSSNYPLAFSGQPYSKQQAILQQQQQPPPQLTPEEQQKQAAALHRHLQQQQRQQQQNLLLKQRLQQQKDLMKLQQLKQQQQQLQQQQEQDQQQPAPQQQPPQQQPLVQQQLQEHPCGAESDDGEKTDP